MIKTVITTFAMAVAPACQDSSGHSNVIQPSKPNAMQQEPATRHTADTLTISSPAFSAMDFIPAKYTCDGADINPPLDIGNIPPNAKSLVLIVDDPDAPRGTWDHWIVWNIRPQAQIAENSVPGIEGLNDFGKHRYGGPCPPGGVHRYFFKVYALDQLLHLPANTRKSGLEKAMEGHILAKGELAGKYRRG